MIDWNWDSIVSSPSNQETINSNYPIILFDLIKIFAMLNKGKNKNDTRL